MNKIIIVVSKEGKVLPFGLGNISDDVLIINHQEENYSYARLTDLTLEEMRFLERRGTRDYSRNVSSYQNAKAIKNCVFCANKRYEQWGNEKVDCPECNSDGLLPYDLKEI